MAIFAAADEPALAGLSKETLSSDISTISSVEHHAAFDGRAAFALRTQKMDTEVLDTILRLSSRPDVISLAGGLVGVLPPNSVRVKLQEKVMALDMSVRNYASTEGYRPLREVGAEFFRRLRLRVGKPEDVIINSGGQQTLFLLGEILANPGDTIITESPTYPGALQAWLPKDVNILSVATDTEGMVPEALEEALRDKSRRIPFIYMVETFQNPGGFETSWARKVRIAELAETYNVRIVADDPYKLLRYRGEHIDPIQSLVPWRTIYMHSVSKIFEPTARLALVTAPDDVLHMMVKAKQGADLFTGHEGQARLFYYLTGDDFADHIYRAREVYGARCDVMSEELDRQLPGWNHSNTQGGMFIYAQDPTRRVNTTALLPIAAQRGVAFVPGAGCFPPAQAYAGENGMRLNFTFKTEDEIRRGITILADTVREYARGLLTSLK